MKIPFDIKFRPQIESGEYKVENRARQPVRIICWNKKSEKKYGYHIVALIEYGPQHEESASFTIDGKVRLEDKEPELFIITAEPELSEFEKGYMRIVHKMKPEDFNDEGLKIVKEEAAELLELAKKEILKDLPRWRKADGHRLVSQSIMYDEHGFYNASITKPGCRYITEESLRRLPVFNE